MKTAMKIMGMVSAIALGAASSACAPSAAASDPAPEAGTTAVPPARPEHGARAMKTTTEAKISAPIEVTLTTSAKSGTVVITQHLKAQADIPRVVARIVLPSEVRLVSGQTQVDLGPLGKGAIAQNQVTVEVPATGQFRIFAGADCHITSGILLHKGAEELVLGQ